MVRSGFWNSVGTDVRTYYNSDFSHLISLLITDGVYQNYGSALIATTGTGMQVIIQKGECWFNECWVRNDADLQVAIDAAPIISGYKRIDAIAVKIDASTAVREGTIEYVAGTPGSNPSAPVLTDTEDVKWHLLCHVLVEANVTSIAASKITNYVGTSVTPFITGILETINASALLAQWRAQFTEWLDGQETAFNEWFENLQYVLDGDVAGHLQVEIDNLSAQVHTTYNGSTVPFRFGIDENGDYGYYKAGETSVTPFRNRHTETYRPTARANNNDMGLYHKYRYVDTTAVPNINNGTYNATSRSGSIDLGSTNSIRYLNTNGVPNSNSGRYSVSSNGSFDMGATNDKRYVDVSVPNALNVTNVAAEVIHANVPATNLSGYTKYLVIFHFSDTSAKLTSISGCGGFQLFRVAYAGAIIGVLCTSAGTLTVTSNKPWCEERIIIGLNN